MTDCEAVKLRDTLSAALTSGQVTESQRLIKEWKLPRPK
jgi:hypothetical protein